MRILLILAICATCQDVFVPWHVVPKSYCTWMYCYPQYFSPESFRHFPRSYLWM